MEIIFENVNHTYNKNSPYEFIALNDINLKLEQGKFYAIIGHTGSGKSTLIQHINALLKPTEGKVSIGEYVVEKDKKSKSLKQLRKFAGLVFQFPEHQLFEETIEKDVMFGPINFGVSVDEAKKRARETIELVGLDESYLDRSPFELSGGQMRRVAIAGVLAMNPDVLILDEPTAGLDPKGQKEMMELFKKLQLEYNKTIILVSHHMEDVLKYAEEVVVMNDGSVFDSGDTKMIFKDVDTLNKIGLDVPNIIKVVSDLKEMGLDISNSYTVDELVENLTEVLK